MKKFIVVLIIVLIAGFVGYKIYPMLNNSEENVVNKVSEVAEVETNSSDVIEKENEVNNFVEEKDTLSKESMYKDIIDSYKNAYKEFDLDEIDGEDKLVNKYELVSPYLIAHVKRYSDNGISLSYVFYDIDKNGIDELIVGASGAPGAIYTYNEKDEKVVKIFFQDTMERGDLSIYDNGIIVSSGSGGAALHLYEFGKIVDDVKYEVIEKIEEEYTENSEVPTYKDLTTSKELKYKSLDEIMNKYILDAKKFEVSN